MTDSMTDFRRELDFVDRELCKLLERRFEVSKRIGNYKKEKGMPIEDLNREKEIIEEKVNMCGLQKDFIRKLYELVFEESKKVQREGK